MKKNSIIKKCLVCETLFSVQPHRFKVNGGKYCSPACYHTSTKGKVAHNRGVPLSEEARKKLSISRTGKMTGASNHSWKGGITSENKKIRESVQYRLWREAVFARDNWACVKCSKRGHKIQADHINPFSLFPELRFAIDNGQTLCYSCHRIKTQKDMIVIKSMQSPKHNAI